MTSPFRVGLLPMAGSQQLVKPMFRTLSVSASGLSAQRVRMETIAGNIANAETTRTPEGGPYRRRVALLDAAAGAAYTPQLPALPGVAGSGALFAPTPPAETLAAPSLDGSVDPTGVQVTAVVEDASEGPLVYDPGHPDADASGYVRYPNVRVTDEIVDLMDARRVFEANATVFQSAKQMLRRSIDI